MKNDEIREELLERVAGGAFNFVKAGEYLMKLHHDEFVRQVPAELVEKFTEYYNRRRNSDIWAFVYNYAAEYTVVREALSYATGGGSR